MSLSHLGFVLACAITALPTHAQPSLIVTLSSIRGRIHSQNPDLAAANIHIDEARARMKQSGRLTNPELETSFQHNPAFNEGAIEIALAQRFPLTNRLQLEKAVSQTQIQVAEMEVKNVERRLVDEASSVLIEVLAIRQQRGLLVQQNELTSKLSMSIREAAEKGEGSLLDAGQADVDALQASIKIRQLDATEAGMTGKLKTLLGMRIHEGIFVSGTLPNAGMPSNSSSLNARPDYHAAKLETHAAAQAVALEQARRLDDAEAGIFTGVERTEDAPDGLRNEGIIGVRFKIALPFWTKNEGKIEEAQATHSRKRQETVALGRSIELEAEAAFSEMQRWQKLADEISQRLLPLAADQAAKTEAAYKTGQADFQSVIRSREQRLQLASSRLDALREFHLARVRYQSALGNF